MRTKRDPWNWFQLCRVTLFLFRSAKLGTETLVFLDLGSRQNNDTAQLRSVLEAKLRQGRLAGGLDVREPGDNWFRVISGPGQLVSESLARCYILLF